MSENAKRRGSLFFSPPGAVIASSYALRAIPLLLSRANEKKQPIDFSRLDIASTDRIIPERLRPPSPSPALSTAVPSTTPRIAN